MLIIFTEERINKLEKELEDANDLLAAARQRGNKHSTSIDQVLVNYFVPTCNPSWLKLLSSVVIAPLDT